MARVRRFPEGHNDALALFARPVVECGISKVELVEYSPIGSIQDGSVVNIVVSDLGPEYFWADQCILEISTQITKANGNPLVAADKVGLVNIPMHAYWRQVEVSLQETVITNGVSTNYPWKAYLDIITQSDEEMENTELESILFEKDSAGNMDKFNPGDGNLGLKVRADFTKGSAIIDMAGPLFFDLAQQKRLIPNNVKFKVSLYPTHDSLRLMTETAGKYRTKLLSVVLKMCKVTVTPEIVVAHNMALEKSPFIYPHTKSVIKAFSLPKDITDWSMDDLFSGQVPQTMIVGLLDMRAYSGDVQFNPFNFQNFGLNFLGFYVSGVSLPGQPFQPNYAQKRYVNAYRSLYKTKETFGKNKMAIKRGEYPDGYCLYVFDVDGHYSKEYVKKPKYGHTRLSCRFSTGLVSPVTLMCYATFGATLLIDKVRNVSYEDEKELYDINYRTFNNTVPVPGERQMDLTEKELIRIQRRREKRANRQIGH